MMSAATAAVLAPGPTAGAELLAALLSADPGTTIELGAGTYRLDRGIDIAASHVTLRGAGRDKTVISFGSQQTGSDGILATASGFTVEDLTVEDAPGNAIKVVGADGVTFRRVGVRWTKGSETVNGPYGLYPVQCKNVLIEDCVAQHASDAGIYVGQSQNVIVRGSRAEGNVAGIEIENTAKADVYDNVSTGNTGGILVFDLPNLEVKKGGAVRVFRNKIQTNNLANFGSAGTIVASIPAGTGVMVLACDRVEIFDNEIAGNQTVNVAVVSFHVTERKFDDPAYDPIPEGVSIHDNRFGPGGTAPSGQIGVQLSAILGTPFPDILYDGIGDVPPAMALRLANNGPATFANVKLGEFSAMKLMTGQYKPSRDAAPHAGRFPHLPAVKLKAPKKPRKGHTAADEYRAAPRKLSAWGLESAQTSYELNTQLFSDHSTKHRRVKLPPGQRITYRADGVFEFPVGTVIAKSFAFGERTIETRIEVRRPSGWYGYAYLHDGKDATLALGGAAVPVGQQTYQVPSAGQCLGCHEQKGRFEPLGPTAANLNRDGQLDTWKKNKLLNGLPAKVPAPLPVFDDPKTGSVAERARAWLAVNCAHCHNPDGGARTSGLDLRLTQTNPANFGVMKTPVAAGRGAGGRDYDIVPGHPEKSILTHRLASNDPGVRMPSLGRQVAFPPAIALVEEWIRGMPESK